MKNLFERMKPFIAVTFMQVGLAGMDILSKAALNRGMSNYVLVVYRHAVATLVIAPFAAVLDRPVIDQNLYFLGMKYTTATFASAIINILPAITFVMACIIGLEKVSIRSLHSQAKIAGTIATVAGAMFMTLIRGPVVDLFWTRGKVINGQTTGATTLHNSIKGTVMITIGSFSWASFMIPAELSLTAWICLFGTIEGTIVALVMERGNPAVWSLAWNTKLAAAVYSGVVCSGLAYYIQGVIMKDRGPVFVTAFSPLCMVIVAVLSTIIFAEQMYLVVWGKSKDYEGESATADEPIIPVNHTTDAVKEGKERADPEIRQPMHVIEV